MTLTATEATITREEATDTGETTDTGVVTTTGPR